MQINISHDFPIQEVLERIKKMILEYKIQYSNDIKNLNEDWTSNSANFHFKYNNFFISGTLKVNEESVKVNLALPFFLRLFGSQIRSTIEQKINTILN
jgi:hypothetical protein